jgi:cobyric acid synthase
MEKLTFDAILQMAQAEKQVKETIESLMKDGFIVMADGSGSMINLEKEEIVTFD